MTVGSDTLYFAYDASTPMSVTYNGSTYYYVTNLQGDVTAILNTAGAPVVTYTYDAWGNILSANGTMADSLGTLNPLRYRSYVYDHETGLYYLQSRYYDPELGRFINADVYTSTGQGLLGNNMFAYCLNNPVRYIDPSGRIAIVDDVVALGIVVIVAVLAVVIITSPPVQQLVYGFCEAVVSVFTDVAQNVASITEARTKGKERVRDTGLADKTDAEVQEKAHDNSLPSSERRRYQTEEKARGLRNRSKRNSLYQIK